MTLRFYNSHQAGSGVFAQQQAAAIMEGLSEYEQERLRNIEKNKLVLQALALDKEKDAILDDIAKRRKKRTYIVREPKEEAPIRQSARIKNKGPQRGDYYLLSSSKQEETAAGLPDDFDDSHSTTLRRKRTLEASGSIFVSNYGQSKEFYDETHLAVLGTCKTPFPWMSLEKVYDKENGTTCHQCRQKTKDPKTRCTTCQQLRGMFCGICLQNRYGENLNEVLLLAEWSCPSCRDICNCSICRTRKGWPATGILFPEASFSGYPSVAHYLVQKYQRKSDDANLTTNPDDAAIEANQRNNIGEENGPTASPKSASPKTISPDPTPTKTTPTTPPTKTTSPTTTPPKPAAQPAITSFFKNSKQDQNKDGSATIIETPLTLADLKNGDLIACRAPADSQDRFWLASVKHKTDPNRKTPKNKATVRVQWFEKQPNKNGYYYKTDAYDDISLASIFCKDFTMKRGNDAKAGKTLWKPAVDLNLYCD